MSFQVACAAFGVGLVAITIAATHLGAGAKYGYPGRACLLMAAILAVAAGVTAAKLVRRIRNARRLSADEDARLTPGQLTTKYDRGVKLGQHLFDIEADKTPDGADARDAWLAGRTVGPADERGSDEASIVGIYRAADPLPLYGQSIEGNRIFLVIYSLAVIGMGACTLAL